MMSWECGDPRSPREP